MRRSLLAAGMIASIAIPSPWIAAQGPSAPDPLPQFEVAAVKENKSGAGFIRFGMLPGGRFTAENVPLRELLRFAYPDPAVPAGWAAGLGELEPLRHHRQGGRRHPAHAARAARPDSVDDAVASQGSVRPRLSQRDQGDADPAPRSGAAGRQVRSQAREVHDRLRRAVLGPSWWRPRWARRPGRPGRSGWPGRSRTRPRPRRAPARLQPAGAVRASARPRQPVGRRHAAEPARAVPVTEPVRASFWTRRGSRATTTST